jgi:recombination protein RecT
MSKDRTELPLGTPPPQEPPREEGQEGPSSQSLTPAEKLGNGKPDGNKKYMTLREKILEKRTSILKILPRHVDVDKLITVALVAASRDPQLLDCTPPSVIRALMIAAQLGLEPGGPQGHGWILPYRNKGRLEAQWQTGYKGFIELAQRSGRVTAVVARVVYEKDQFEYEYGTTERIRHIPTLDADRGKPVAAYAIARLKEDAAPIPEVMSFNDIDRIRNLSKAKDSPAWTHHWDMMARKTVVRRLANYLPQSPDLSTAMEVENRFESGVEDIADLIPGAAELTGEPSSTRTEQVKAHLAGSGRAAE